MIVSNVKIYDLEESLIASGYPMRTELEMGCVTESDIKRGARLSKTTRETGDQAHDQFLTGIRVNFDLTFSNKAWVEAERYRFLEFVSSQSTMHRIVSFDLEEQYNNYVDRRIINIMKTKVKEYLDLKAADPQSDRLNEMYLSILYSNPCGFRLTARMTTNYRCLKNIYKQRKTHRLPEWREFCQWIETLPYAKELILTD